MQHAADLSQALRVPSKRLPILQLEDIIHLMYPSNLSQKSSPSRITAMDGRADLEITQFIDDP